MQKLFMATVIAALLLTQSSLVLGGTLTGEVTYVGEPPQPAVLKPGTDQFCTQAIKTRYAEDLVVSQAKGIQNVVVSLFRVTGNFGPPKEGPVLDQVNCAYTPHVLAVLAGTTVNIRTSDPTLHNVHSHAKTNEEVNWAMPIKDMTLPYKTTGPEEIHVSCDVHNWMSAYIIVMDNPYFAVTGAKDTAGKAIPSTDFRASKTKGSYRIENIPAGTYRVQAWHETLGIARQADVVVPATGEATLNFTSDQFKKRKGDKS
jgi:plastocyanin